MAIEFSAQTKQRIDRLLTRYPTKQAALLPVLHLAQDEFGHLSDEALHLVAGTLDLPAAHVFGVITFYTMFHREASGRNELMVCTNVSCMLRGGYDILHHIEKRLGIKAGESTPDGVFPPGRGGVPGGVRERPDDDLRGRLPPGSDRGEGRRRAR